jgi:hypothetical protein
VGESGNLIAAHIRALRDCNQRGGRLLSLVDLIDAGTVDLDMAGYLAAVVRAGGSLLVGARAGGAGKTALMVALLNFLPNETALQPIEGPVVLRRGLMNEAFGSTCYLAHEIGEGFYYAYLWDDQARAFFELAARGHTIASNLHADTLPEARTQLIVENGVDPAGVDAVTLKVFLRLGRTANLRTTRWVGHVYESTGPSEPPGPEWASPDRLLWVGERRGRFVRQAESRVVSPEEEARCRIFLEQLLHADIRTIEDVRQAVVRDLADTALREA